MTFREKLVRLRKMKSLTQDEFASAVGVSRQAVYKWESGQSYPEVAKLLEIKLLFGISIDDLLDESYEVEMPEKKKRKRISKADRERIEAEVRKEEGLTEAEETVEEAEVQEENTPVEETASEVKEEAETVEKVTKEEKIPSPVTEEPAKAEAAAENMPEKKRGFFARLFSKK